MTSDWLEASIMPSLASSYEATASGCSFDDWINADCLDLPPAPSAASVSPAATPPLPARSHAMLTPVLPAASPIKDAAAAASDQPWQSSFVATPFGPAPTLPAIADDFAFDDAAAALTLNGNPAARPTPFDFDLPSPTPSLSGPDSPFSRNGDAMDTSTTDTAASSPRQSLKRSAPASPSLDDILPAPKRMLRTRQQQQQDPHSPAKAEASSSSPPASRSANKTRQPHNQVEKKYREGLNTELERLRRAVRTLPQPRPRSCSTSDDDDDAYGGYSAAVPKPSKAAVLAGAVEYIRYLETEHERLANENEQLRDLEGLRRRREDGWAWRRGAEMGYMP